MHDTGYRRLLAAVLLRACEDARGVRLSAPTQSPDTLAADALEFLRSDTAGELAAALGIDGAALASRTVSAPPSAFLRCGRKLQNTPRTSVSAF